MEFKKFNINHEVKVKLTDYGYQKLADYYNQFDGAYPNFKKKTVKQLKNKADENGFTTFQMWNLMQKFGSHVAMCKPNCFETDILIKL